MTPIPSIIPRSAIDLGLRARTEHLNIEELAESIEDSGLNQPIVIVEKTPELVSEYESELDHSLDPLCPFLLTAGGRRTAAIDLLGITELHYGLSSRPGCAGFVVRENHGGLVEQLTLELKENLDRDNMDWRDELRSIVKIWRLAKKKSDSEGQRLLMRDFGKMLGCGYADLQIADKVYDHFVINPEQYSDCTSISGSLSVLLRCTSNEVARMAVGKAMAEPPDLKTVQTSLSNLASVPAEFQPKRPQHTLLPGESPVVAEVLEDHVIPLSKSFLNCDGLKFMSENKAFCDHIVCDPDYAVEVGVLDSNPNNRKGLMKTGVHQADATLSLHQLFQFLELSFSSLREHGFCVFWYALDHHEKLMAAAEKIGFRVQHWPLIWNKMDFRGRSNAAPNHNFPKSVEYAMVLRKPGTVLRKVQTSCVFTTQGDAVTKALNHPFAKPFEIWKWIYAAIANPGQVVFDPFCGSGSSAISAITYGLRPIGTEINEDIYNHGMINIQNHYRKLLGQHVRFS